MFKDDKIYVRVDAELKELLKAAAKVENRTLSSYIETILKRELERANPSGGGTAGKEGV